MKDIQQICREQLKDAVKLEIIDVIEHPELAEHEKIIATPTVIRELPPPLRRIIGDLSNAEKVLLGLDLLTPHEHE